LIKLKKRVFACSLQIILITSAGTIALTSGNLNAVAKKKKGENTVLPSEANFNKGVEFYKARDFDSAADAFLQAVYFARNGYNSEAYFWLGKSYMAKHEDTKALEAFKKHVEQSMKETPDAHYYMGEIYLRNNQLKEAEDECEKATMEYGYGGYKAHNLHGKIIMVRGDYANARSQFMLALGDSPWTYTDAWMNYAECYLKQKDWPNAYKQYNNMLTNPKPLVGLDLEKVTLNIGICVLAKGDHQGAIDNFRQVLTMNGKNADAHLQMAMVFDSENHLSSAMKEYAEFVRYSDNPKKIQTAKERIATLEQKMLVAPEVNLTPPKPKVDAAAAEVQKAAPPPVPVNKDSGF
jgi:Tfp pilus assembly protein PilF